MTSPEAAPWPRPAEFKTQMDGRGGLIRVTLVGEPHDGRELFIDEQELPDQIWTSPDRGRFEWWPARVRDSMPETAFGGTPPVHYVLRIPEDTREPLYISDVEAR